MAVTSKKILDANISTCAVAGTAEEVSSFIESVGGKANKSEFTIGSFADYVSALFSSNNTALVSVINNIVGVPNALLEAALSGEEVA